MIDTRNHEAVGLDTTTARGPWYTIYDTSESSATPGVRSSWAGLTVTSWNSLLLGRPGDDPGDDPSASQSETHLGSSWCLDVIWFAIEFHPKASQPSLWSLHECSIQWILLLLLLLDSPLLDTTPTHSSHTGLAFGQPSRKRAVNGAATTALLVLHASI